MHVHSLRTIADLKPGEHLCCLYKTEEEHRAVLTPFLRRGLEQGQKVLYIVDAHTAETILGYLRDDGLDVEPYLARGQLTVLTVNDAYMREEVFDPDGMIALLQAETERALAEGYPALRVTGEMTWVLRGLPGSERLIEYEAKLNEFFPGSKCLAICQYDQRRFDPQVLLDVLRTHPIAVVGTDVYDNFYYIPPAELLSGDLPAVELRHCVQNLAERQRAEREVQEAREYAESIVDTVRESLVVLDADLRVISANHSFYQTFRVTPEETEGRYIYELGNGQWRIPELQELLEEVLSKGTTLDCFEVTCDFPRIGQRTMLLNARPMYREAEKPQMILLAIEDISERKQAEEEIRCLLAQIREQARQMQQVMDTVPEGMLLLDASRRILMTNLAAREYLPVLTDAGMGDVLTHLGGQPIGNLLKPPTERLRHELLLQDPRRRVFEVAAHSLEAGPEAGGWVLMLRDVTQEREIQERIQQQEHLAAVGQLAAGIAHDFNNIMAVILLYAQMLSQTEDLLPKNCERLDTIIHQAKRAASLIEQILDFSRASVLERRPLNLVSLLKELLKLLERTLPENIKLELEYGRDDYIIHADPTRMQQVFMNLALNARDAMPEGGELRISLARLGIRPGERPPLPEMPPGEWVRVAVSDTGTGIPPEVLPHLFEPFFTTKAPGQGTGLGLAQVYGIVKQHDGYIGVETQVGQGTTFTLYLPAMAVPQVRAAVTETAASPKGSGETILVVEDDPATCEALVNALEMLNYRVLAAANGREALEIFDRQGDEITLVLSDLVMPEMGGTELFHALKRRNPAVKMVVLSGYPLGKEARDLRHQGVMEVVQKPVDVHKLAEAVKRVLQSNGVDELDMKQQGAGVSGSQARGRR